MEINKINKINESIVYEITGMSPTRLGLDRVCVVSKNEYIHNAMLTMLTIREVIFNDPATIVFWMDGSKTVVKTQHGEIFDPEKGLAMAMVKKALGNKSNYFNHIKKWTGEYDKPNAKELITEARDILATVCTDKNARKITLEVAIEDALEMLDEALIKE